MIFVGNIRIMDCNYWVLDGCVSQLKISSFHVELTFYDHIYTDKKNDQSKDNNIHIGRRKKNVEYNTKSGNFKKKKEKIFAPQTCFTIILR